LSEPAETPDELNAKADTLEPICRKLVDNWKAWAGDEAMTHYMHFIDCHLVDQVRLIPLDTSCMSMEGLENKHQESKGDIL
jgi:hypothetical protein